MRVYLILDRLGWPRSYLGKILLVCFVGVHIPLIGAVGYLLTGSNLSLDSALGVLTALLVATVVGTGTTMAALYALLAPVRAAAGAINGYLRDKQVPRLPTRMRDEAGVLMANIQEGVTRLDAALDAAHSRLRAVETESRSTFDLLSSMSHELRTPLNHIIGFAEMMATEALGPLGKAKYRDYAMDIGASGGQLLSVVQSVLELSEAAADQDKLSPIALSLAESVRAAVGLVHLQAQAQGVEIRIGVPATATAHADPRAMKQMLLHALTSAIETAGSGHKVTVVAHSQAGTVALEIAHDGAAWIADDLPADLRDGIPGLRSYSTAQDRDGIRSASPQALRLAVIRSLARTAGGSISVRHGEEGGRVLRISMPAVAGVRLAAAA